jgi:hypothetical protein
MPNCSPGTDNEDEIKYKLSAVAILLFYMD